MKDIVILGTGGTCVDILDTINDINRQAERYRVVGFLDDDLDRWGTSVHGVEVLGGLSLARELSSAWFVNGIGSPSSIRRKREILATTGVPAERFETIVHPSASVSALSRLGRGVVLFQQVTITTNVTIGDHVVILPSSVVSHDDVVGECAILAGGVVVSGNVRVGESCYLGANAAIREGVTIGDRAIVGMGSVVLEDVPADTVVAGVPARRLGGP